MKIFQRPRRLGIGLCFQNAPLDPHIAEGTRRLAQSAGYYGVLQLEFIRIGERYLLIDYNPRFYNQLAFDIARGLQLPMLAYAAARGATDDVRRLVEASQQPQDDNGLVFCNEFGLSIMLVAQRLMGQMSPAQALLWQRWRADHDGAMIDPALAPGDMLPGFVDVAAQLHVMARHPRAFLRKVVLDRTPA
jgi:D-aspartate ligase